MRKIIPVVVAGATTLALAGGAFGYVTSNKDVTLSVDGQAADVSTTAGTVGDLLASKGIAVTEHDVVAPSPSAPLTDGTRVAVQYGRAVTFTVDGKPQTVWTTATSLDQAIASLGIDTTGAAFSTSRSTAIGRQGLDVTIATQKKVTVVAAGKKRSLTTTAGTVGAALAQAKVTPDADDKVNKALTAPLVDGATLTWTKVEAKNLTRTTSIGYDTVRKSSAGLTAGTTKVTTTGRAGSRTTTYKVVTENGRTTKTTTVSSRVTSRPRTQVVLVGTKAKKAVSSGSSAPSVASGGVWDKIAACESGGNWSINTGNGFYGGLQFSLSTWRAYGGSGMPNQASRAAQIAVAKKIQAAQGWGAWPACTAKLGLR
ncbi:MAG: hypothetical protein JWP61_1373 [Friedmanniella sp.]|nr:hypothetical protein [Friedmanniella sp.]